MYKPIFYTTNNGNTLEGNMNINGYIDYINAPWGRLFYRLVWHNLEFKNKKILDYGSGFGVSANHFAESNSVIAIEPNQSILEHRICDNYYNQIIGSIDKLKELENGCFDVILCHNVLEYIEDRGALLDEFYRLLKKDGVLSIVKHNRVGKIIHKSVFENNTEEALALLRGDNSFSQNFGIINEYEIEDLRDYISKKFILCKTLGIRTFYGIQHNSFKSDSNWEERMFQLECAVESNPTYSNIAFFQHLILKKE